MKILTFIDDIPANLKWLTHLVLAALFLLTLTLVFGADIAAAFTIAWFVSREIAQCGAQGPLKTHEKVNWYYGFDVRNWDLNNWLGSVPPVLMALFVAWWI